MFIRIAAAIGTCVAVSISMPAASQGKQEPWPEPRPLGAGIPAFKAPEVIGKESADPQKTLGVVTLPEALRIALRNSPEIAAQAWEVRALEGRIRQAGLLPNPEVGAEVENFGGSEERQGFDSAEATLQISQLIELGGKRSKRTGVAQAEQTVAGWDYEAERLAVYAATGIAFFDVLTAQRLVDLRRRQADLAVRVVRTVRERLAAGRITALEETKARVAASGSRIALERAQRTLDASRSRLVAAWGGVPRSFERAEGLFENPLSPPPLDEILRKLSESPHVKRAEAEFELQRRTLSLERARQVPDVTVSAGIRSYANTDDNAFVAGVSIPIPVFGMNPGGVMEAERRLPQSHARNSATRVQLESRVKQAYSQLLASYAEIRSLTDEVLPGAQQAYDVAQTGYREGRFGFLDVLDAQRTLFEARASYVESLATYHRNRIDQESLIGHSLAELAQGNR